MKHSIYYAIAVAYGVIGMFFLCAVDGNYVFGIMAIICFIGAAGYSDLATHEEMNMIRQIKSNADEDRPE